MTLNHIQVLSGQQNGLEKIIVQGMYKLLVVLLEQKENVCDGQIEVHMDGYTVELNSVVRDTTINYF
jgi:hypothetical protein